LPKLLALAVACAVLTGCGGGNNTTTAGAEGCVPVDRTITGPRPGHDAPTTKLDVEKRYDVTFVTNCGNFTIRLDPVQSPNAAASFAALVQSGFYDTTMFHRIVPGTLFQGGDPTASGLGGTDYSTVDTPPRNAKYTHGVVAMAKTPVEPPGTAGSQFFVVTADDAGLTPDYAIVGTVVDGLDVVDRIGALGNADETPSEIVELVRATLTVSRQPG
jgi:peptidyl-prolyl cis-trans isomerase B (cyclophilin B)